MTNHKIAILGLGYVGLPLCLELAKQYAVLGFDTNKLKIQNLKAGFDSTNQANKDTLSRTTATFSHDVKDIATCDIFIVCVPTPTKIKNLIKLPDLSALQSASSIIASVLKKGDIVIYESSTYPGCTQGICKEILSSSGLVCDVDFSLGYSPERVSPGRNTEDKHLKDIIKLVSASNPKALDTIASIYQNIGIQTQVVKSIEICEMAKLVENTQRNINIAFVNEIARICHHLDLDTNLVLDAAKSKWNFLPFSPGLVGGHCIDEDLHYLSFIAREHGFDSALIRESDHTNTEMCSFIAKKLISILKEYKSIIHILILGATYKENCPDMRNSKAFILKDFLACNNRIIDISDPLVHDKSMLEFSKLDLNKYECVVILSPHQEILELTLNNKIVFCLKGKHKNLTHRL